VDVSTVGDPGYDPSMDEVGRLRQRLSEFAEGLPGAHVDFPWGERVVKVGPKVFVFLGSDDPSGGSGLSVKLLESHDEAMATPGAKPSGYGLGRAGWVSIPLDGEHDPPAEVIEAWVVESYRRVAPKKLAAQLAATTQRD
jgi:predicted DNA-binding protein (MmcQ/YjbR family)